MSVPCSGTSRYGINWNDPVSKPDSGYSGRNNYFLTNTAIAKHAYYNETVKGVTPEDPRYVGLVKHSISDLVYRALVPSKPGGSKHDDQTQDKRSPGLSFRDFCTTQYDSVKPPSTWEGYLSLEMIHNNLHNFIGGQESIIGVGHMSDVPVAAFDPIFYMHHNNIDRIFAIWQTLYPDTWFDEDTALAGMSLPPFRKSSSDPIDYWTSNDTRDWRKLGYDFDILSPREGETTRDPKYIRRLKRYLNNTYPHTGQVARKVGRNKIAKPGTFSSLKADEWPDYIITLLYDRYALNGMPYSIHFFLGDVDDASISSRTTMSAQDPRHVGSVYTFSGGPTDRCGNCKKQQDDGQLLSCAQIPLTLALYQDMQDPNIPDINFIGSDAVTPYLKANLTWKAISTSGEVISPDRIPRTRVFVLKGTADHLEDEELLSDFGNYRPMPQATEGKAMGAAAADYETPADGLVAAS